MTSLPAPLTPTEAADVLHFWFSELTPDDWYGGGADLDGRVRARFLDLYGRLAGGWADEDGGSSAPALAPEVQADSALASVLVLDQFPRNMFRGTAQAFATDFLALSLARRAVDAGWAETVPPTRRQFFFIPFMHAENLEAQDRCVELIGAVLELADNLPFAVEHREIVRRFGRFPHRNRALGRRSLPAEEAFIAEHQGFGQ